MAVTGSIRFIAADVPLEGVGFDVELTPAWLDEALGDAGVHAHRGDEEGGRLHGRLSRSGQDIVVRARVRTEVEAPCVRCLSAARVAIDTELSLLLQPRSEQRKGWGRGESEREFTARDAELDVYDGEAVVLDEFVREAILLEMPSFPLCRESCPGLLPAPVSADISETPVDPRLMPLHAFREKGGGPVTIDELVTAARERAAVLGKKPMLQSHRSGPSRKKR